MLSSLSRHSPPIHRKDKKAAESISPRRLRSLTLYSKKQKSGPLSQRIKVRISSLWWRRSGSNRLPLECHSSALPSELRPQSSFIIPQDFPFVNTIMGENPSIFPSMDTMRYLLKLRQCKPEEAGHANPHSLLRLQFRSICAAGAGFPLVLLTGEQCLHRLSGQLQKLKSADIRHLSPQLGTADGSLPAPILPVSGVHR